MGEIERAIKDFEDFKEFYCASGKRLEEHPQYCEIANERIQKALAEPDKEPSHD